MNQDQRQNQIQNQQQPFDDNDEYEEQSLQHQVVGSVANTYRNKQVSYNKQNYYQQFDVNYNNEDYGFDRQQQQYENYEQQVQEDDYDDDDDEDDNPMAKKLKEMKQQLRNQIQKEEFKDEDLNKKIKYEEDEDNQGYDEYRSPEHKFALTNPIHKQSAQSLKQEDEKNLKDKPLPSIGQQIPIGNVGVTNYDKIKNSKLFQKFIQKETQQKVKEEPSKTMIKPISSKSSLQPVKQKQPSPGEKNRKPWGGQKQSAITYDNNLNLTQQTHEDFYEQKLKMTQGKNKQLDPNLDFSMEGLNNNQFLDDSHFYQNPVQQLENLYFNNVRPTQDNKAYLLDNSELNNEGELIGYSEQILGKINDMAPGIPNQDDVLHQPPESFVNMMHEQFNNEMPWLINARSNNPNQSRELPFSNVPQQFDYQNVEPMRQDVQHIRNEMKEMQNEYQVANERFTNLKEKYDKLQADYSKDKNFYEEALEVRMNQLEQLENENETLNRKLEEEHRRNMDIQGQLDQSLFDNDMIKRNLNSNNQTKDALNKKEEELFKQIKELQDQLREKQHENERGTGDQARLQTQLERATQEIDRLKQQLDYSEQNLSQKDSEKNVVQSQINDLKQRLQQEQTDHHYLRNENEELKNEIIMLRQQVNMSNNIQEQLRQQLFEMKDKLNETEHRDFLTNSTKELMQREIQQLKMQLSQANQFIQQQAMFYTQAAASGNLPKQPPTFQVQTTNWDQYQNDNYERQSTQSRESAVPTISPFKKSKGEGNIKRQESQNQPQQSYSYGTLNQAQNHQLRSNNVSSLLQWDDQPIGQPPQKQRVPQQQHPSRTPQDRESESNITFPNRSNMIAEPSNVSFPTRNQVQETNVAFPSRKQQQQEQEEMNIAFPSRPNKQKQQEQNVPVASRQQNRQVDSQYNEQTFSQEKTSVKITQKNQQQSTVQSQIDQDKRSKQLANIESNLLQLNIEKDRYKAEFDKIPENAKTIAQRRRREELERELDILNKNIGSLKTKLRDLEALH